MIIYIKEKETHTDNVTSINRGRYRLEPIIGTFSLTVLVIATTHFFIDLLLITTFKQARGEFQHFYLFVHFVCLIITMILMIYGFAILHKPNYHSICNFRSWTLLLSLFLGFSGSFACLGFALDFGLFHQNCLENVFSASVAAKIANYTNVHKEDSKKEERFDGESTCKDIFDGLLCTQLILYFFMEVSIVILFLNINSFKATRFEKEDKITAIRKRKQLAERNKRLGVRPKEEGDEVEGINVQDTDIIEEELDEIEKGKGRSVTFAKGLNSDQSPISDSDLTNFMSSPSTDHERSPPVEGFLSENQNKQQQPAHPLHQNRSQLLPHFHLPLSSPFFTFRTPKSSTSPMMEQRNPLFHDPQSPFSASIPTPPPVCSPLHGEDEEMIFPISPFDPVHVQGNVRHEATTQHHHPPIPLPVQQQSNSVPKIIIDYYDEDGKIKTEDPIKRAFKAFTASKNK